MEVLKLGQVFAGRYRVLRRLAEGGMGAVYVALQEATELEVALKVLWPHVLQRSEAVGRFALEAKISARIRSDHIVQVFDAGFDQETQMPFLVMELLQGLPLQGLVERRGALPPAEAIEIIKQTARGLDRAHAYKDANGPAPVIHRDLKPDNIFVARRETGEPLVKILDYGIAKILSQSTSLSREIKGTPIYMAYEQAVGQALSPQTDVWALGLIAYFSLTGTNYWRATRSAESSLNTLLTEIVALPIEPASLRLTESNPQASLPPAFDAWFLRCVNRDPASRFASAGEAARELAAVFTGTRALSDSGPSLAFDATIMPQGHVQTRPGLSRSGAGSNPVIRSSSDVTGAPASITQSSAVPVRSSAVPWVLGLGVLGIVGVAAFAVSTRSENTQVAPAAVVAQAPAAALPPPPAVESPAPAGVQGVLEISPREATVKVNGEPRALPEGKLALSGMKGTQFQVEVALGDRTQTTSVRLLDEGSVEPSKIALPEPGPKPVVKPAPDSVPQPIVPAVKPPKVAARPAPAVKTAAPVPAQPAPPPPKKKAVYDPLSGPRVH